MGHDLRWVAVYDPMKRGLKVVTRFGSATCSGSSIPKTTGNWVIGGFSKTAAIEIFAVTRPGTAVISRRNTIALTTRGTHMSGRHGKITQAIDLASDCIQLAVMSGLITVFVLMILEGWGCF